MKNKMCLLAVALLLMFSWNVGADTSASREAMQQSEEQVSGVVVDEYGPVAGAAIRVKDLLVGTITDADGKFFIGLSEGAVLVVSFLGYQDREVVWHGEDNLTIKLEPDSELLDEVQVVAYGTVKKVTVTGAISSMNSSDVMKTPTGSITNALSGKISGLASVQSKGQPGEDDATLYVRGVGSLSTDLSSPLVLVDGVERSFSQLDPNEIADITVLKDASATAVFGVRGANGVILVTTKRGEEGKVKINVSTSYAVQIPTRIPEFADSYDYAVTYNQAALESGTPEADLPFTTAMIEGYRTHSSPYVYPDVDWADLMLRKAALQTQHNFTMSGGTKTVRYFVSLGAYTQEGLYRVYETDYNSNYRYNRYNYRINLDVDITKSTLMKINLGGRLSNQRTPNYNNATSTDLGKFFQEIYNTVPFISAGIVDGKYVKVDSRLLPSSFNTTDPLQNIYGRGYRVALGNTLNFDFILEQKLDFITKGLAIGVRAAIDNYTTYQDSNTKNFAYEAATMDMTSGTQRYSMLRNEGTLSFSKGVTESSNHFNFETRLSYDRQWTDHKLSGLLMYSMDKNTVNTQNASRAFMDIIGQVHYAFKGRYILDFSMSGTASSVLEPGHRWGVFPAVGAAWLLSEEPFMKSSWLDLFKIRASYGISGMADYDLNLYRNQYGSSDAYFFGETFSKLYGLKETVLGISGLTYEKSHKADFGIDLGIFNRLALTADVFYDHRTDILTDASGVTSSVLGISVPKVNNGVIDNYGAEASLNWNDRIGDFSYNIGGTFSYVRSKIISMNEQYRPYDYQRRTGLPVNQIFGYVVEGIYQNQEQIDDREVKQYLSDVYPGDLMFEDLNGDYRIDENDMKAIGYNNVCPEIYYSFWVGAEYRGIGLYALFQGAGNYSTILSVNSVYRPLINNNTVSAHYYKNRWTPENPDAKYPRLTYAGSANNYNNNTLWVADASFLKLRTLELSYRLPESVLEKTRVIKGLSVFARAHDLFSWHRLEPMDPENVDDGHPLMTQCTFGINLSF